MNNLSDFANFGELHIFWGVGAPNGSLRPGRQRPSLRLWTINIYKTSNQSVKFEFSKDFWGGAPQHRFISGYILECLAPSMHSSHTIEFLALRKHYFRMFWIAHNHKSETCDLLKGRLSHLMLSTEINYILSALNCTISIWIFKMFWGGAHRDGGQWC